MSNPRLSRFARLSLGGVVLTVTASAGAVAIQTTAGAATAEPGAEQVITPPITLAAPPTAPRSAAPASAGSTSGKKAKLSKAARQRIKAGTAVSVAKKQVGDPYRWGASGPNAFDCSGLVMYSWRKAGVKLPRITGSQYRAVKKKVSWKNLKPGDLMFFSGFGHVGMYVGHGKMIHSPHSGTRVQINKLSSYRKASFVGAVRPGA
ncbi:C40 family peptidase [Sphaerisporangium aureirubrum]|uniref:C40 family peptidase n=1 Tax=Sphaerisporangium aureirubrum TaxID=1544736 RepID=A0ABW1NSW5_9ACTN